MDLNDLHCTEVLAQTNFVLAPLCKHLLPWQIIHLGTAVSPHDTLETIFEPLDRLLLVDAVASTNLALGTSPLGYPLARSCPVEKQSMPCPYPARVETRLLERAHSHAAVKVHAIDTNCGIILDAQINVLANAESEVASL